MIHRASLLTCLSLLMICLDASVLMGQERSARLKDAKAVEAIVLGYCQEITSVRTDFNTGHVNSIVKETSALQDHWSAVLLEGYPLFRKMMQELEGNEDTAMRIYLREMMNSSTQDSIRLLMAAEDIVMPLTNFSPYDKNSDKQYQVAYSFQIAAAKAELLLIESNPDFLADFYRIAVWRGVFLTKQDQFITGGVYSYAELISGEQSESKYHLYDSDAYLWYLRNFLFLCVATGREDLIPENLSEPEKQNAQLMALWEMWFKVHRSNLISSPGGCSWKLIKSPLLSPHAGRNDSSSANKDLPALNHLPVTPFKQWHGTLPVQPVAKHPLCT
ncbi:hypothetical protein [Rubinisphaera sp.]|uniref:hypothetical protein n=1 Tax=Rubinisphaera sp. TaxID=2024857 RepID=UPI000C0ED2B1|nr:hypothetical protein [Rubinisphaera sp.]MBV08448.1 hypothetical protein [Rubinisphaera sp.]HCS54716.1 hypothetical protein [Planctomycetaceae bacterium]